AALAAVDRDVLHRPHQRTGDLVVEDLLLRHEPDVAADVVGGVTGVGEVHVPGVVDHHHGAAVRGQVLRPGPVETQALVPEHASGETDHRSVNEFHARQG